MSDYQQIYKILKNTYPGAKCELEFSSTWQLLVATILSAQCTDIRVNLVTKGLFEKYPDALSTSKADVADIINYIKSTGLFNNKAKFIIATAKIIVNDFAGKVPNTLSELITLPGVARKVANVVLGVGFNINEGIAVDTHVNRLSQRLGLSKSITPEKVERALMKLFPQADWENISTLLIHHGRNICRAKNPKCESCPLAELCPSAYQRK